MRTDLKMFAKYSDSQADGCGAGWHPCAPVGGALWARRWTARPAGVGRRVANPPQVANLPHKSIRVTIFFEPQ